MEPIQKIAQLLRTTPDILEKLFAKMEELTGRTGVAQKIFDQNQQLVERKMKELGIDLEKADAQTVGAKIYQQAETADRAFFEFLEKPDFGSAVGCQRLVDLAKETNTEKEKGFFLKEEKMRNFLVLNPPQNILKVLSCKSVDELLSKENIFEIFAALRFVENERWLNEKFFRPYHDLGAENFEERETKIMVLPQKWEEIGQKFVGKKLHNISHLKEAGLIFVIPIQKEVFPGQTLETFSLILHYLHEIGFYCRLFRLYAKKPNFGESLVSLLSGEVSVSLLPKDGAVWRIIQRYLAKFDPQDPRLFEPHVNPETLHWFKAEKEIDLLAEKHPELKLDFWRGMDDFCGEVFPAGKKGEEIVSFDLLDNVLALTHGGLGKYLYHQQEALWNKIFMEFTGEAEIENLIMENIIKGFIELEK